MIDQEEILDVLDDAGTVIGTAPRSELFKTSTRNFRLVSAFIRNADGLFYMLRRSYDKKSYGGRFGSVGGCVQADESYEHALFREIEEEVGLTKEQYSWRLLGTLNPQQDDTVGFVSLYELTSFELFTYNENDFCELKLISLDELQIWCSEKKEVTHNLPIYLQKFYNARP